MSGYTKLFGSIVGSTVWRMDDKTRLVWITMMALADSNGIVECSIPGLADFARVALPDCEAALVKLSAPDRYSRTPDQEGRRITETDGGWLLINHGKYQQTNPADRREYQRKWQKDYRDKKRVDSPLTGVDKSNDTQTKTYTQTKTETKTETEKQKQPLAVAPDAVIVHATALDERTKDGLVNAKAVENAKAYLATQEDMSPIAAAMGVADELNIVGIRERNQIADAITLRQKKHGGTAQHIAEQMIAAWGYYSREPREFAYGPLKFISQGIWLEREKWGKRPKATAGKHDGRSASERLTAQIASDKA